MTSTSEAASETAPWNVTKNGKLKWRAIKIDEIDRVGMKFNPEMVRILAARIQDCAKTGKGINILIEGDICRGYGEVISEQGHEISHTLYDNGPVKVLDWDPSLAYSGRHLFWLEGFKRVSDLKKEGPAQ
jgi:hypothetical protein